MGLVRIRELHWNQRIIKLSLCLKKQSVAIQLQIVMNQIKGILKANLARDALDVVFWGNPTQHTFQDAFRIYKSASMQQKHAIEQRAFRKLGKSKQPKIGLAILCLLDHIMSQGYQLTLTNIKSSINTEQCKSQKQKTAQLSFFNFYHSLLTIQSNKPIIANEFNHKDIHNQAKYCQIAIQYIFKVLTFDFLLDHCISKLQHKQITNIIANKIIKHISIDLQILSQFLNNHISKITDGHQLCFNINQIYEKTIHFGKQKDKLQKLKRKLNSSTNFEYYKFNSETNKKIEKYILSRDVQRRQFISEKHIGFAKNIEDNIHNFGTCPDLLCEDDILLSDQLIN